MFGIDTKGVYAIAPTPFLPDGAVDYASIDRMCDFYLESGVDGLTILGILGEAPKLEPEESVAIVKRVLARFNKPVVVGVSAPGFAAMRALSGASMDAGAAGVMINPPPAMRTDDEICNYYAQSVAQIGADVPFVLQDHPLVTTVRMSNNVIRRIVTENPSCVMLKHEDWPGLEKVSALRKMEADGTLRHISILCGNGGLFLDFEMERGADGAMTGYAFPDMLVDVVKKHQSGDNDGMHALFDAHLPYLRYEHQSGIGLAVRKYVLVKRGAIAHADLRAPGPKMNATTRAEVDGMLARLARHDPRAAF
ncbi:dihydrodipicolinate synthase family protein [Acuticoccus sp. MNP-M23]|uniref:dihydrodipicolinate synthase family protein n=1 Tax=Acuticoccus sp. MNP-M23 TaxID=3072793 RepID=UPI002815EB6C|nr:dihydrodipicolinate synthase family protein [Acuticoccus sp. MNP-M23]WMS44666.1 dihydrodipicolinate synthase family protein [Acuticoccus sp. MNP-M23]